MLSVKENAVAFFRTFLRCFFLEGSEYALVPPFFAFHTDMSVKTDGQALRFYQAYRSSFCRPALLINTLFVEDLIILSLGVIEVRIEHI